MSDHGKFYWNTLLTRDLEGAKKFYSETLGWNIVEVPIEFDGVYREIQKDGEPIGGMVEFNYPEYSDVPDHWLTVVSVDNLNSALEKVQANGGQVIKPATEIPNRGIFAVIADQSGAKACWMQPTV